MNSDKSGSIATTLTNPGIIDRLEQDIQDYLHEFGFSIQREERNSNNHQAASEGDDRAVLYIPTLPSHTTSNYNTNNGDQATPIGTLRLHIKDETLLPTVGPLLRTLLRLAVSIPPQQLRAILYCDFILDPLHKLSKMSTLQQRQQLEQQEEIASRKMVNAIHMLVRNSMGSALFLDMIVMLPCYWRRKVRGEYNSHIINNINNINNNNMYEKESVPISTVTVKQAMENNPDAANYPSIHLTQHNQRLDNEVLNSDTSSSSIELDVSTRMCTVKHQPILFRWVNQICCSGRSTQTPSSTTPSSSDNDQHMPLIIACIEKPGNLHRVLMLCHDYMSCTTKALSNLIVVMPNNEDRNGSLKHRFQGAIDHFRDTILRQENDDSCAINYQDYLPTLMYEDDAVELIQARLQQPSGTDVILPSPDTESTVIGIDLHPTALTLSGSNYTSTILSPAQKTLMNAGAIVFGYESTGIPPNIDERLLKSYVQIPSRSSINLVAAMSIIFDAIFHSSYALRTK